MDFELIHADGTFAELGQITEFNQFDAVVSADAGSESDWMLELPAKSWQLQPILAGHYVYISGSEWGGPVERVRHSTSDDTVRVYGACWRSLLSRRAICPASGETHVIYENMDTNDILRSMLSGWMTTRISVYDGGSGIRCSGKVRYDDILTAMTRLLENSGGRLCVRFSEGMVKVWTEPTRDFSEEIELSQEYECSIVSQRSTGQYDHIIALGQGEMLERTVVELWLLPDGTVTSDGDAAGVVPDERSQTLIYEYTAAESRESLAASAAQKLRSCFGGDSMEIVINGADSELELSDRVSVRDHLTGMLAVLSVTEKNLNVSSSGAVIKHTLK